MRIGIHLPNAHIKADDLCRFRIAGFQSAKLMWYHAPADVLALMDLGCRHFLVRLPDSVAEAGRIKGDSEWAGECVEVIEKFAPLGITDFQLCNEPNLLYRQGEAPVWRWLTERVVNIIREYVPANVRLGLAPLSWKPDTWANVETEWIPEQRKIADLFSFCCVHAYWQQASHYNLPPFGGNCTEWHDKLMAGINLPIVITEWANSVHERRISAKEVERLRVVQYVEWLRWVSTKPYVEGAYLFILSGTDDWRGFHPTDKLLRAIGTVIDTQQATV